MDWKMKMIALGILVAASGAVVLQAVQDARADGLVKITKERIAMDEEIRTLCIGPERVVGPHAVAEVDLYVNPAVLDYRKANPGKFDYPIGSVFVKEKYPAANAREPDLATKMEKVRNSGTVADWVFSMHTLPEREPIEPKGRVSCASCHERYERQGFVSGRSEAALVDFLGE